MAGFATTIKLGRPRSELSFTGGTWAPSDLAYTPGRVASAQQNGLGETFLRARRRRKGRWSLAFQKISETQMQALESMVSITDTPLSFIWAGPRSVFSERLTLDDTTHVTLGSTPETLLGAAYLAAGGGNNDIITINGVFADYNVFAGQSSTNYYTGGSYNATTRQVTLGNGSPGAAGTVVYVNWSYTGALVYLPAGGISKCSHHGGEIDASGPLWDVTIDLEGA